MPAEGGRKVPEKPLVVVAKHDNALRLVAASPQARRLGLVPGLAFADAKARVPHMAVAEADPLADRALLQRLADGCDRYTPVLCLDPPHGLVLEIAGSAHLFDGEAGLADDLRARLAGAGLTARIAIAGTAAAARALCRFGPDGTILAPGTEARGVAGLPVDALEEGDKTTLALRRAGLATLGDLAGRPRAPLAARFGGALTERLARLLGEIDRPITARRPVPDVAAALRFADPIGLLPDIEAAVAALGREVCAALERQGRGGRRFEASFFRADGAVRRIEWLSARPLRDAKAMLGLARMRLDALVDPLDPGFGFDMIRLAVPAGETAAPRQVGLADTHAEGEGAVAALVDRLAARFGPEAVRRALPLDSHLPERAVRTVSAVSDEQGAGLWHASRWGATRPLFLFARPHPIEVVAEVPEGPPRRFRWRRALHDVALVEGPERIAPQWWREGRDQGSRDYFRVEDQQGRRFWLFRYGLYGREPGPVRWFVHGLFP